MPDWPIVQFEELAADEKSSFSKPYGSAYTRDDYVPNGVPLVRGVNLGSGIFHDDDFVFITEDKAKQLPGASLTSGDIVITHRGTIGQVSMIPRVPRYPRYALSTSQVKARLNPAKAASEFYYYWLRSPAGQHELLSHVSTVGVPGLVQPVATVKSLKVPRPPLDEQTAIADILGALDDKIAVNQRIAVTVDSLASSIYENSIKIASQTKSYLLGDVAVVNVRSTKPSPGGSLRYVDISSVGVGSYDWPDLIDWAEAPGRARRQASVGDTIWTTVRPNRRSHAFVLDDDKELVFSTGLAILSPRTIGPALFHEATKTVKFQAYLENVAEGSAYPAVRADRFNDAPLVLPDLVAQEQLEKSLMSIRTRAHQASKESRTLIALRDTILPQLMSGKLCVRDAEKIVESTV